MPEDSAHPPAPGLSLEATLDTYLDTQSWHADKHQRRLQISRQIFRNFVILAVVGRVTVDPERTFDSINSFLNGVPVRHRELGPMLLVYQMVLGLVPSWPRFDHWHRHHI